MSNAVYVMSNQVIINNTIAVENPSPADAIGSASMPAPMVVPATISMLPKVLFLSTFSLSLLLSGEARYNE